MRAKKRRTKQSHSPRLERSLRLCRGARHCDCKIIKQKGSKANYPPMRVLSTEETQPMMLRCEQLSRATNRQSSIEFPRKTTCKTSIDAVRCVRGNGGADEAILGAPDTEIDAIVQRGVARHRDRCFGRQIQVVATNSPLGFFVSHSSHATCIAAVSDSSSNHSGRRWSLHLPLCLECFNVGNDIRLEPAHVPAKQQCKNDHGMANNAKRKRAHLPD